MSYLVIDVESTTYNNGNPFTRRNKLCAVGTQNKVYKIEYDDQPYGNALRELQAEIDAAELLVGFNFKYDLHWLRRYGIRFQHKQVWDVQLAHFILSAQLDRLPSLNDVAAEYNLGEKLNVVEKEYWDKGIQTTEVPWEILAEYNKHDVWLTGRCYTEQLNQFAESPKLKGLLELHCEDLLVLEEMEWNGIRYDKEQSLRIADEYGVRISGIEHELGQLVAEPRVNWNSDDHVSCALYGGVFLLDEKEPYEREYKDGRREWKERWVRTPVSLPRLVEPLKRSKLKKDDRWSTAGPIIKQLKAKGKAKKIIELMLERSDLEKARGTYFKGLPELLEEMDWGEYLHGTLHQVVAVTGRLSSSRPNMQNMPEAVDKMFKSRYDDGVLLSFDVKGLEVVTAAWLSGDPVLRQEVIDGVDFHALNQERFKLPTRVHAKRFKFKMIYGGTAHGFSTDPDLLSVGYNAKQWEEVINAYYAKYRGIESWHGAIIRQVLSNGELISPSGRVYDYSGMLRQPDWYYVPKIKNYPVQGFGADIVCVIRCLMADWLSGIPEAKLINTVHDSIYIDTPRDSCYNIIETVNSMCKVLPKTISELFDVNFDLPLSVEAKNLLTGEKY